MASAMRVFLSRRNCCNLVRIAQRHSRLSTNYTQRCFASTKETKESLIVGEADRNPLKEEERDWISYGQSF